jgi:hypothetical protein
MFVALAWRPRDDERLGRRGTRREGSVGTVSVGRPLASVLGWVGAATCALTGIAYAREPQFEGAGDFLATLAGLGALALAAVSLWQGLTAGGARTALLILLSVLAAGFVAANALALVASSSDVPEIPRPLHVIGTISGSALYLEALVDVSVSFLSGWRRPRDPLDRAMPV